MGPESIVYGCIKDVVFGADAQETHRRRQRNRDMLDSLPSIEDWPLLAREMFSTPQAAVELGSVRTDVTHFGISYRAIEYEWEQWLQRFEALLQRMYWVSATVHLETEFNGVHTFVWEADGAFHEPDSGRLQMRCEWTREALGF